jgi:hypothetical protein
MTQDSPLDILDRIVQENLVQSLRWAIASEHKVKTCLCVKCEDARNILALANHPDEADTGAGKTGAPHGA